ncbi:MAG: hypothetical protein F4114_07965 [Rhodospirillaceae bacterium]|nr:hypothetical protein [Rhodospirillaceae bacterium]MYB12370.1 hypothetical protein [Rhodospirillaceae bacterium]MYI49006.1 hypothetical protein [Rhodospirillaceae bacterium]
MHLYEDIHALGRSQKLVQRVESGLSVLNSKNLQQGVKARRGDGSFGEIVPNADPIRDEGFAVLRGPIATIEIGIEVKIMMKAMIKQIDRVANDLQSQVNHFRQRSSNPISVGIVGINHSTHCTTYEGDRAYQTDGKKHKHPIDEAAEAEERLKLHSAPIFDEFIVLRFRATNEEPFKFEWVDKAETVLDYGAALVRIGQAYDKRI